MLYGMSKTFGKNALTVLALASVSVPALSAQVILNGGFEADAVVIQSPDPFTNWGSAEDGIIGAVSINQGSITPSSGTATVGAAGGTNYAVLDLASASSLAISQSFVVGPQAVSSAVLSFSWFGSYAGQQTTFLNGIEQLDWTGSAPVLTFRADIVKQGSAAFSTSASDVVFSLPVAGPIGNGLQGWNTNTINVTGLQAGGAYVLRFAAAANDNALVVGLDDVALNIAPVPEPTTWAMMIAGLFLVGGIARKRSASQSRV